LRLIWPSMSLKYPCMALLAIHAAAQCHPDQRRVTVSDAIEMTRLGVASYMDDSPSNVAQFSPDGRRFALVLKKGNLERNTNDYTLEIFKTQEALSAQKPETVVRMSSNSNREAIHHVKWLRSSGTVLFIGEKPNAVPQIYSFDIARRQLQRLTDHLTPVVSFDASDDGRVVVFEADPPARDPMNSPEVEREGFRISGEDLGEVVLAGSPYAQYRSRESRQLFLMIGGGRARQISVVDGVWPNLALSVSPNGRYALVEALVRNIPKSWLGYRDRLLHEFIAADKASLAISSVEQYLLLDTVTGAIAPLIDAPKSWEHDGFLWIDGGKSIVLSKAYLPLTGIDAMEQERRGAGTSVIEVLLPSRETVKIRDGNATAADWIEEDSELSLQERSGAGVNAMLVYRKRGNEWEEVLGRLVAATSNPRITYEQDMNTPPKIWITNTVTGNKTLLLDPNPQFKQLCFGRERMISWQATDGHPVRGGLYLPPDYDPSRRYPLVIQTHAFDPGRFWIDGPWSSAFAAQPLAAKDIVVLQIGGASDRTDAVHRSTPSEGPGQMAAFEGAIDYLDNQGIIDRESVGIIGFSRTVYHVAYTLTHSKYRFRAVTLADGFNGGYFERIAYPNQAADPDAVNGGPPYGTMLPLWFEHAPAFNLSNVTAPVRLEGYGVAAAVEEWEWFSLSSGMKKPIDFLILPRAPHLLVKPWERRVSQQGNLDWFAFWLKGAEDPSPEKQPVYARWHQLRDLEAKMLRQAN